MHTGTSGMSDTFTYTSRRMTDSFRQPRPLVWVSVAFVIRSLQRISWLERAIAVSGIDPGIRITPTITISNRPVSMIMFSRRVFLFALE